MRAGLGALSRVDSPVQQTSLKLALGGRRPPPAMSKSNKCPLPREANVSRKDAKYTTRKMSPSRGTPEGPHVGGKKQQGREAGELRVRAPGQCDQRPRWASRGR